MGQFFGIGSGGLGRKHTDVFVPQNVSAWRRMLSHNLVKHVIPFSRVCPRYSLFPCETIIFFILIARASPYDHFRSPTTVA